ncbi:MAG: hypothetical protein IIB02_01520 [Thaumarchaeota archaeon]|nr:hypothetical protein [Nitrososphaerota archaeon]
MADFVEMIIGILIIIGLFLVVLYTGIIEWNESHLQVSEDFDRVGTMMEIRNQVDTFVESLRQLG